MENKLKLITRILLLLFWLFSVYSVVFMSDNTSNWLVIPLMIGMFTLIGLGVVLMFGFVGICQAILFAFFNWAFDTDFFD